MGRRHVVSWAAYADGRPHLLVAPEDVWHVDRARNAARNWATYHDMRCLTVLAGPDRFWVTFTPRDTPLPLPSSCPHRWEFVRYAGDVHGRPARVVFVCDACTARLTEPQQQLQEPQHIEEGAGGE